MRAVEPGHVYAMRQVDGGDGEQVVRFVRRRGPTGEPLPLAEREPGILTQELLRVAIDRTLYLYAEAPCEEDTAIVGHLRAALVLYEARAARRHLERLSKPELADPCPYCGHVHLRCEHGGPL